MSRIDRLIRAAIERAYATAKTGDSALELAKREVALALQRSPFDLTADLTSSINSMIHNALRARDKAAGEEFGRQAGATSPEIRQLAQAARKVASERMATVKLKTSEDAMRIVTDVLDRAPRGMNARRVAALALKKLGIARHHAKAEADAARSAIDNIGRHDAARVAGITTFRYSGPTVNVRTFCGERVGLVFHADEIAKMDNGQGLPVVHYCGGYNCRHRWTPFRYDPEPHRAKIAAVLDAKMEETPPKGMPSGITGRDIVDSFDPRLPGVTMVHPKVQVGGNSTSFSFLLTNDDELVGFVDRVFSKGERGYEVEHKFLKFNNPVNWGRGSATRIMENSIALYDRVGVKTIRVEAALSGGHASWAKMGFEFDEETAPDERDVWKEHLAEELLSRGLSIRETFDRLSPLQQPHEFMNLKFSLPNGRTFSGSEWKETQYPDGWHGKVDLDNPDSRRYIDDYIRRKVRRQP